MRVVVSVMVIFLGLAMFFVSPSSGQDRTEERLSALETRVAELEAEVYGEATPPSTEPDNDAASNVEPGTQLTIGGTALDLIPPGEDGEVDLVAVGPLDRGLIPLVVRNNTDEPVEYVTVKVEARDAAGELVAVGETLDNHMLKPYLLQPGELTIGFAFLQGDVPPDATFDYTVNAESSPGMMADLMVDLEIVEVTWLTDRIVGVARNPTDQTVGSTYMNLVCFADDGTPNWSDPAMISENIGPNETASFQVDLLFIEGASCERFLIAATTHPIS